MPATASVAIRTLFSPFDDTERAFLEFIGKAQHSIYILIYGYHLPKLGDTLLAKHAAGIKVNVILDHSQEQGKAEQQEVQRLIDAGVPLLVGTSPIHGQILHSKFSVVDESAVEFGSWNYSTSASKQSNTMSFVEDATYARSFLEHYHRIHAFILLHDMAMQPAHEVVAEDAPQEALAEVATHGTLGS